jgi:hypothetical protein
VVKEVYLGRLSCAREQPLRTESLGSQPQLGPCNPITSETGQAKGGPALTGDAPAHRRISWRRGPLSSIVSSPLGHLASFPSWNSGRSCKTTQRPATGPELQFDQVDNSPRLARKREIPTMLSTRARRWHAMATSQVSKCLSQLRSYGHAPRNTCRRNQPETGRWAPLACSEPCFQLLLRGPFMDLCRAPCPQHRWTASLSIV